MRQLNAFKQRLELIKHKSIRVVVDSLEEQLAYFLIRKRETLIENIMITTHKHTVEIMEQYQIFNNEIIIIIIIALCCNSSRNLYCNQVMV